MRGKGQKQNRGVNSVKVYIPESFLSFEGFNQELPRYVTKERIAYFVSVVASKITWKRDEPDAFVNICSSMLQEAIKRITPVVDFVLDSGYVISDNHYVPGEKCRGFRINPVYDSRVTSMTIKDKRIIRCIRAKKKRSRVMQNKNSQN